MQPLNPELESLVKNLKPVKRLPHYTLRFLRWMSIGMAVIALMLWVLGLRQDYGLRMHSVNFWVEICLGILTLVGTALYGLRSSVPRGSTPWLTLITAIPTGGWVIFLLYHLAITQDWASFMDSRTFPCAYIMFTAAFLPLVAMITLINKGAPSSPKLTALMSALAAGGVACVTIKLICPMETIGHLIVWHLLPFCAIVFVGGLLTTLVLSRGKH